MFALIVIVTATFVISLCLGILALGGMVNLIEIAEKSSKKEISYNGKTMSNSQSRFVSVFDNPTALNCSLF